MVSVVSRTGKPLMPTTEYKARRLLKKGRAEIFCRHPFTVRILDRDDGNTQPIEYKSDTGYLHVGISICSDNHEYVSEQRDLLADETEKHNDRRKYRRARRNRKRYRTARFDNRRASKKPGWVAPSLKNRMERQTDLFRKYASVIPITQATFEMGMFDTQLLKALSEGKPVPGGIDYQHGEQYGMETLRAAVFARDGHKCIVCGRGIPEKAILHEHHIGFWKGDRSDRPGNLATVCEKCHTSKNHKPGGKLYGLEPKLKPLGAATYMTAVRFMMLKILRAMRPDITIRIQYGAKTKLSRKELKVSKSHANDAYAIGQMHPKHRTNTQYYRKRRRNNRILEKFYDARYIDIRDGQKKAGSQLGCNRTDRRELRMSAKNERIYHGEKVSKGRRTIRTRHYMIQPGTILRINGHLEVAKGIHCNGSRVMLASGKSIAVKAVTAKQYPGGWILAG